MKNFIILLHYKVAISTVEEHTPAHREYLKTLYASGDLLLSGPRVPRTGGVLWAQANDKSRVDEFISQDPFYLDQVADYEVIEMTPVMHSKLLDPLFEIQKKSEE